MFQMRWRGLSGDGAAADIGAAARAAARLSAARWLLQCQGLGDCRSKRCCRWPVLPQCTRLLSRVEGSRRSLVNDIRSLRSRGALVF